MREHLTSLKKETKQVISSNSHHTVKLKLSDDEQKRKNYFSRIRGYRDRK